MTSKTGNRTIPGLTVPGQDRPVLGDGPGPAGDGHGAGGDRSPNERRHQGARASAGQTHRQTHQQASATPDMSPADMSRAQWDDADWAQEAARRRAHRLPSKSDSRFRGRRFRLLPGWLFGTSLSEAPLFRTRWVRRLAIVVAALAVIFAGCFGVLWWRLGAGPINLDMATPWLAAAIEENIGHGNTVEVGGTQIERAGRIRIAVRIRDIVVRDNEHAVVATAPKAEVRLSGAALLMGRLRAESLNLVDAELAVRITPDGNVTVSTGDTTKPLATGVASKRQAAAGGSQAGAATDQANAANQAGAATNQADGAAGHPAPEAQPAVPAQATGAATSGLLAGLDWLDSLSLTGLDGQNLNEIGLKNGSLVV